MKNQTIRALFAAFALAAGFSLDAGAHSGSVVDGVLINKFGDPNPDFAQPRAIRNFFVAADDGHVVPVDLSNATIPDEGLSFAINRRVRVTASSSVQADQLPRGGRFPANSLRILDPRVQRDVAPISGSRQYLTLLCKWGGDATEPAAPSYFVTEFGNSSPGFNHFFQEVSNGRANINASSVASAWVTLPQPQSFYFPPGSDTDGSYLEPMAQACINAAEVQLGGVDFSSYEGINFMFNGAVDSCCAWGGGAFLSLDGSSRVVSATWMPYFAGSTFGWRRHSVLAHELSHSFQTPPMHSDDPQGYEYGNFWDVVSSPAGNFAACPTAVDPSYGCVGQHQIANHKILMDFVAPARIATHPNGGASTTYTIERAANAPNAGGTFQYVKVASNVATKYWTVESRKRVGYDTNLPGDGVIIMEVITNRPPNSFGAPPDPVKGNPARLITPTLATGANLGGLPSRWLAGDSYLNTGANVKITVVSFDAATGAAQIKVEPATTPGEFSFVATTTEVNEGAAANVNIAVTRTAPFTGAGSVVWTTSNGTAIAGTDFGTNGNPAQRTSTLTWTAGTGGTKNITVGLAASNIPVINNTAPESDKDFSITLSSPTGGILGAQTTNTVTINDVNSVIAFDDTAVSVSEAGPNVTVQLTRTGSTAASQAVTYTTTAGTATATSDYTTTTGTVTFGIGETTKVITIGPTVVAAPFVRIINDSAIEGPETFNITLSGGTNGAVLGTDKVMVVTINSDENGVSMATATRSFAEGDGAQTIVVNRSGAGTGALDVNYAFTNGTATNGDHFAGANGALHWADGDLTSKSIPVTINDNGATNAARTFTVTLSGATAGTTIAAPAATTATITDNDNTVQFTVASATVTEGTANLVLTVSRTGVAAGQSASVTWTANNGTALLGTDFGGPGTGTLTWAAGNTTSQTINIPIVNDLLPNGARTFSVALSSPTGPNLSIGTNSNVAVTLNDNEKVLQFEFPTYSVNENASPLTVTIRVQRSVTTTAATATWATVNGTATAGQDFGTNGSATQRSGSLSWAIGDAAAKTIIIPILNDNLGGEGDETFTVMLTPGSGYILGPNAVATVTIHDDDIPPETNLQFSQPKYVVMENGLNAVLTVTRTNIGAPSLLTSQVTYATVPGTALATSDYTTKTGTLNWPSGDFAPKDITIAIVNNATPEPPESFRVTLSGTNPGTGLGTPNDATVLIVDDDEVFPLDGAMPAGFTTPIGATKGWHVSNDPAAYDGSFSLKSDEIDDSETAGLQMAGVFAAGTVRFYVKVSTEPTFDTLQFFIDGALQATWSGTASTAWQLSASYPVSAGHHTLSWIYTKDGSASVGMDAVYLDGLTAPAFVPDP